MCHKLVALHVWTHTGGRFRGASGSIFLAIVCGMSQEVVENDLQTDPENHLHQPHLNTPIITLSPPHSDE